MDNNIKMSRLIDAVIAFTLISVGGLFLVENFLNLGITRYIWPIFVLAPGGSNPLVNFRKEIIAASVTHKKIGG